jgi:cell fate (sporulation/competence/biofilm development) regulator YlbF (YheA/YmcA/DUF963 family)
MEENLFDEIVENAEENPIKAVLDICNKYLAINEKYNSVAFLVGEGGYYDQEYVASALMECLAALKHLAEEYFLDINNDILAPSHEEHMGFMLSESKKNINTVINNCQSMIRVQKFEDKLKKYQSNSFSYEFSENEVNKIQSLVNELRDFITISKLFEEKHKQRLLKRLEKLQQEMHKKMSNVDIIWGFVGDAGVVMGKFGKDAKPMVDRIKEITQEVWKVQSRSEGLPEITSHPLLGE